MSAGKVLGAAKESNKVMKCMYVCLQGECKGEVRGKKNSVQKSKVF